MSVIVSPVPSGSRLFDSICELTPTQLRAFKDVGADGVIAYLGLNLTKDVCANAFALGLGVVPVSPSRADGWIPTADLGVQDGATVLRQLQELAATVAGGLPLQGMVDWADVEGCGADPTSYIDSRSSTILAPKLLEAGMYVGAGALLSAKALYALPQVTRYWRSCSDVPEPLCAWCLEQCRPGNLKRAGTLVDINFAETDLRGRSATWWVVG